jgi:hypothetical protein
MALPRVVLIDGKAHRWADLLKLRREQATPDASQPALFSDLKTDCRPPSQRKAASRYAEPTLLALLEQKPEAKKPPRKRVRPTRKRPRG